MRVEPVRCPICRSDTLKECQVKNSAVKIDICTQCKGIWFDSAELEKIEPTAAKELAPPMNAPPGSKVCPRCAQPLVQSQYPQTFVKVDMCRRCNGLWLEAGELTEIRAVRKGLAQGGKLEEYAPVPGVKGALLRFIDSAIEELTAF